MITKERLDEQTELTIRQKNVVECYIKNMGMATKTCREVGLSQSTFFLWKRECPVFLEAIKEADNGIKDWGESALYGLINNGSVPAILFYNKTKNKDRGYIEKKEVEYSQNEPISINVIMPKDEDN